MPLTFVINLVCIKVSLVQAPSAHIRNSLQEPTPDNSACRCCCQSGMHPHSGMHSSKPCCLVVCVSVCTRDLGALNGCGRRRERGTSLLQLPGQQSWPTFGRNPHCEMSMDIILRHELSMVHKHSSGLYRPTQMPSSIQAKHTDMCKVDLQMSVAAWAVVGCCVVNSWDQLSCTSVSGCCCRPSTAPRTVCTP